jgi:hypothetical protein
MTTTLGAYGGRSTVTQIRGSMAPANPMIQAQVALVNAVTSNVIFRGVSQSSNKMVKHGDDEVVLLSRATNFRVHCEGSNDRLCVRLDDDEANCSFITFPMVAGSRMQWTPAMQVPADAHVTFHSADGLNALSFVDPVFSVRWFVGEWIPKQEEAAYKLADNGFRDAPNPPDGLRQASKKQTWTPWYTSPAPTPPSTPPPSPFPHAQGRGGAAAAQQQQQQQYVPGDGVAPEYRVEEGERQARMDAHVEEIYREMNSLLYTPGKELEVLQQLRMLVSVEPKLLCRADMLSVLRRVLEKTSDPGTARQAIVFADECVAPRRRCHRTSLSLFLCELHHRVAHHGACTAGGLRYMHIDDVVLGANALGLYQVRTHAAPTDRNGCFGQPTRRGRATPYVPVEPRFARPSRHPAA